MTARVLFHSFYTNMTFPVGKSMLSLPDQLTNGLDDDSCELPFCTKDNVAECLSYLNQVFIVLLLFV